MTTPTPPPYGQYPPPPVDPAVQAAREARKTVIWGMSIWVFGPLVAGVVIIALCCGGCLVSGTVGGLVSGDPVAKASADAAQADKDQAAARAGLVVGAVNLRASSTDAQPSGMAGTIEIRNTTGIPLHFDATNSLTLVVKKAGKPVVLFPENLYLDVLAPGATKTLAEDDPAAVFVPGPYTVTIEWAG